MAYAVKEIFKTLQGEGAHSGRAAVFCRFAGCNLWSGREADRETAQCRFCDTDFVGIDGWGGGRFNTAAALASAIERVWSGPGPDRFVVFTGGEPLLQLDLPLLDAIHARGFEAAVETNGTLEPPPGIDWICVSPKADTTLNLTQGHELKLVLSAAGLRSCRPRTSFVQAFLAAADGWRGTRSEYQGGRCLLPQPSALAPQPADP